MNTDQRSVYRSARTGKHLINGIKRRVDINSRRKESDLARQPSTLGLVRFGQPPLSCSERPSQLQLQLLLLQRGICEDSHSTKIPWSSICLQTWSAHRKLSSQSLRFTAKSQSLVSRPQIKKAAYQDAGDYDRRATPTSHRSICHPCVYLASDTRNGCSGHRQA